MECTLTYEAVQEAAEYVKNQVKSRPSLGVVCGSGCGDLTDSVTDQELVDYADIPHFPVSTVPGHDGRLVFGVLNGKNVVCMKGRCHGYEGYPAWKITFPIRVMKELGVKTILLSNASGGINPNLKVGDLMIMKDHIYMPGLAGLGPLTGIKDERFGQRFVPTNKIYDASLRLLASEIAAENGMSDFVTEGVYFMAGGPQYETIAEARLISAVGGDVVGMSTVPEVIVAKQCGMKIFALSVVTNLVVTDYSSKDEANHLEVIEVGKRRSKDMQKLITEIVGKME